MKPAAWYTLCRYFRTMPHGGKPLDEMDGHDMYCVMEWVEGLYKDRAELKEQLEKTADTMPLLEAVRFYRFLEQYD